MTITLRQALATDLDALVRLEQLAFEGDRFSRRQLWHLLNRANALTLLAEDEVGRVLGYGVLLFRRSSRRVRLYSFCVHPEARGLGLGRELLLALEARARQRGGERLGLEVRADNRIALKLYRRMGFRLVRWLADYYADGCAGWEMEKPLEPACGEGG
ncbi:GNAT family N-acetyltransferase [Halomonas campisalis]|uniref:GNAT family N-acetyltransferase n=1 Tax=Billgrantia campisalis TaxID=74661 RepID=A0ABS9PA98_9GAMM|nr:N-acetyltransferase [Halomonas campisalis]MCG6658697.1 GNAT family N-acetyltransferase [Halomonas campisalis]MDR5864038.1 N-acetyltransferase [Halomonas campisalis]